MNYTPEQLLLAKNAKSAEELLKLAKENGIELTEQEAEYYFSGFHKEGELSEDELDNVAGGSQCVDGRSYSSDPPYYLITTSGNRCPAYVYGKHWPYPGAEAKSDHNNCSTCKYCIYPDGFPNYCTARTVDNDPYR